VNPELNSIFRLFVNHLAAFVQAGKRIFLSEIRISLWITFLKKSRMRGRVAGPVGQTTAPKIDCMPQRRCA
jgi:hypothetical protein